MIDDCEEDILMVKQLPRAIGITQGFIACTQDPLAKASAGKVLAALCFAKEIDMPAEFNF